MYKLQHPKQGHFATLDEIIWSLCTDQPGLSLFMFHPRQPKSARQSSNPGFQSPSQDCYVNQWNVITRSNLHWSLQETLVFLTKYWGFTVSCRFSLKPLGLRGSCDRSSSLRRSFRAFLLRMPPIPVQFPGHRESRSRSSHHHWRPLKYLQMRQNLSCKWRIIQNCR